MLLVWILLSIHLEENSIWLSSVHFEVIIFYLVLVKVPYIYVSNVRVVKELQHLSGLTQCLFLVHAKSSTGQVNLHGYCPSTCDSETQVARVLWL